MQNIQLNNSIAIIINTADIYGAIKDVDSNEISLEIQNEAEEVVKTFTYSDIQKIDTGKYQVIFNPDKTGYIRYFWKYKITNIDYKSAGELMIKEFIPLPPAKVEIGSGTVTPGSGAEIDDSITSSLKVWSSFKTNSELLKKSDVGHLHDTIYAPLSHNHNSLYSALTHNHDDLYSPIGHSHTDLHSPFLLGTKTLDETSIGDGKTIAFDATSGKLIFKMISSSSGGATIDDATTNLINTWSSQKISTELSGKASSTHNHDTSYSALLHNHDTTYSKLDHLHDSRYYQKSEIDTALSGKSDTSHTHSQLHDASFLGTKQIDESAIGAGKTISYNATSGKLEYVTPTSGTTSSSSIIAVGIQNPVTDSESQRIYVPKACKLKTLALNAAPNTTGMIGVSFYLNDSFYSAISSGGPTVSSNVGWNLSAGDIIYFKIMSGMTGFNGATWASITVVLE